MSILTISSLNFIYNPTGNVITGDLNIINDTFLRDVFRGPKYSEPNTINWKHILEMLMDAVEDYATQSAKGERGAVYTISEWMENMGSLIQIRIKKKPQCVNEHSQNINR